MRYAFPIWTWGTTICKGSPKEVKKFLEEEIKKYPNITLANYIYLKKQQKK